MDSGNPSPIPTPRSSEVPALMRERHDLEPDHERGERLGRRAGAYGALALCRRVLRTAGPLELARILNGLVGPDDLGAVLRALEDVADAAAERQLAQDRPDGAA